MVQYLNRDKNELLVLTGAVYSFVAYLTAFTLEVLFIIDLAKQSPALENSLISTSPQPQATAAAAPVTTFDDHDNPLSSVSAFDQARLALEFMQTHLTISCLAISVLYFLTFVASLLLVISLILRSTFMLLAWMCTVAALYFPELGLIIYVSFYGWGIDSRNGQTELIFYLFRAALNVIFVYRAHKLWKHWTYERNFFLFSKSSKRFSAATYDSPYFIHGDSLSTTINPVFSSSTLHLDRYDQIRDYSNQSRAQNADESPFKSYYEYNSRNRNSYGPPMRNMLPGTNYDLDDISHRKSYYLGNDTRWRQGSSGRPADRQGSVPSFDDNDDEFADCEMDLDYRTLTQQRHYSQGPVAGSQVQPSHQDTSPVNYRGIHRDSHNQNTAQGGDNLGYASPGGLSYSTQSLDRRHLKDMELNLPEQVILRPLGHQPFDYLYRPGSSSNLASSNNLNDRPTYHSSNSRLAKRNNFN